MNSNLREEVLEAALEAVEREHEMIYVILKKIKYAYTADLSDKLKKSFIKELYQFLDFHFTSEENLLAICEYPDCDRHKKEHDNLRHKLAEIIGSFNVENIDYQDFELFVTDWLNSHTKHSDAHLTDFLQAQLKPKQH